MRDSYGETLDDETLQFIVDPVRAVKDSMNFYFQPVSWAAVRDVPVTYVKNRHDRPVPVALQDEMIGRLPNPVEVIELDCRPHPRGHPARGVRRRSSTASPPPRSSSAR